jgi:gluconate 2-dehydrogenase gamma chain
MSEMNRRDALGKLAAVPAGFVISDELIERARAHVAELLEPQSAQSTQSAPAQPRPAYVPKQFTPDEWRLVRLLVNYVIPRDARSGSATDAGVPEFMDFMLGENAGMRTWMRNGIAWLNGECRKRHGKGFVSCSDAERRAVLDTIAYPRRAAPESRPGVDFFNSFRNLTSSGFWTSRMGIADIGYKGNVPVAKWEGTPADVIRKMEL